MSVGYADALTWRPSYGGTLGAPERTDPPSTRAATLTSLLDALTAARSVVVFTGAGVSTAAGIPDFRGPDGVWTRQVSGRPPPALALPFAAARPTLAHAVLAALVASGKATAIVSQNVDGLHRRSGVPRDRLAELHGNCFVEACARCGAEHERAFEVGPSVGFKPTGRRCERGGCRGRLRDWTLDWESPLPEADLAAAEAAAAGADVALCLGTSLQIAPANRIPLLTVKSGGRLAIVNLQPTPRDGAATWLLRWRADDVCAAIAERLNLTIPPYVRTDEVAITASASRGPRGRAGGWLMTVGVASPVGEAAPLPLLAAVTARLADGDGDDDGVTADAPPFRVRLAAPPDAASPARVAVALRWGPAADPAASGGTYELSVPLDGGGAPVRITVQVETQRVVYGRRSVEEGAARALGVEREGVKRAKT